MARFVPSGPGSPARQGEATTLELVLAEGKKREIRRMLAKLGHKVMSLTRIAIGPVVLKGLCFRRASPLSRGEIELLRKVAAGIDVVASAVPRSSAASARPDFETSARVATAERRPGTAESEDRAPATRAATRESAPATIADRERAPRATRPLQGRSLPAKTHRPMPATRRVSQCRARPLPGKPVSGPMPRQAGSGVGQGRPLSDPWPQAARLTPKPAVPPKPAPPTPPSGRQEEAGKPSIRRQAGAAGYRSGPEDRGGSRSVALRVGPRESDRQSRGGRRARCSGSGDLGEGEDER